MLRTVAAVSLQLVPARGQAKAAGTVGLVRFGFAAFVHLAEAAGFVDGFAAVDAKWVAAGLLGLAGKRAVVKLQRVAAVTVVAAAIVGFAVAAVAAEVGWAQFERLAGAQQKSQWRPSPNPMHYSESRLSFRDLLRFG
mmetsp:Transcript_5713/g.16114  ORF Transcript_5713/g.16114 Transcript_5713/m.16114 type:complete len:138 (+) Transcript_5713:2-415(+)